MQIIEPSRAIRLVGQTTLFLIVASVGFVGAYAWAQSNAQTQAAQQMAAAARAQIISSAYANASLGAKAAIVVDLKTGRTLFEQQADAQLPLASITKVPLVLAAMDALAPDAVITIPTHRTPDGAPVRVAAGSQWHVQDLADYTLVASSNEGAQLLAQAADAPLQNKYPQAPKDATAVWRMNQFATQLNLPQTFFLNPSGLDVSKTQSGAYGSARDVAKLFAYAASTSPDAFAATTQRSVTRAPISGPAITGENTNEALPALPGVLMGKTGYTDLAGGNLAVVFQVGPDHKMVAVVLGSTQNGRFEDMKTLVSRTTQAIAQMR